MRRIWDRILIAVSPILLIVAMRAEQRRNPDL
jgi:hypothetical protein